MYQPFANAAELPRAEAASYARGPDAPQDHGSDRPVQPDLAAHGAADLGQRFGLAEPPSAAHKNARNALILSMAVAQLSGARHVFYSRDRNWFAHHRSHLPACFTYRTVIWAAESLSAGSPFFVHDKASPGDPRTTPGRSRRSTLGFSPAITDPDLAELLESLRTEPVSGVLLRNAQKERKTFSPTALTRASNELLVRHRALLAKASITIDHPNLLATAPGLYRAGPRLVWTGQRALVRIFNGRLCRGGRFYRGFWQQLSKSERAALRINGEPSFEHDYACCHLRLLYAAAGKRFPFDLATGADPYLVPGAAREDRPLIKLAVLILINAKSEQQAVHALAGKLTECGSGYDLERAAALLAAVPRHLPDLAPFWCSNIGPALQFVDSEILRHGLEMLVDAGIVALPVHDSIIVPAQDGATLIGLMESTFRCGCANARRMGRVEGEAKSSGC